MKKLIGITLAVMMLVGLIASPAMAAPTFTVIPNPDAAYKAATTKIDISGLTNGSSYGSISDGTLTVTFDTSMQKLTVPGSWATWSSPPQSESATPDVLYTNGQYDLTMTLSQPVGTFGFELEPNPFADYDYDVDFILMSGPTVIGNITMTVNGQAGAKLFAASITSGSVDKIVIDGEMEFAIAQVRYDPEISVDVDIKPMSDPNSINLKAKGVIPVAVLTTPLFDATTVDGTTVMFAGASPAHDISDPAVVAGHQHDVDGDGDVDFVFHFRTQETGLMPGAMEATLTGMTLGGIAFAGTDSVRTVPPEP